MMQIDNHREEIEWTNYWWESANNLNTRRILLLGDSVSRQFRSKINKLLKDIKVDFFGSSANIFDSVLKKQLNCFFSVDEYKYDLILLHFGGHHGFDFSCYNSKDIYINYKKKYEELINYLQERCPNIAIITSTWEVINEKFNEERNNEISARNKISIEIAQKYDLQVIDLCFYMLNEGKKYQYTDNVHFEQDSNSVIARKIIKDLGAYYLKMQKECLIKDCLIEVKEDIESWELENCKVTRIKFIPDFIFSIKYSNDSKHKIINLCGIKLKVKFNYSKIKQLSEVTN